MTVSTGGCRSCANCHDYDPPVANCDCHACGTQRSGSASGGYDSEGYAEEGDYENTGQVVEQPAYEQGMRNPVRQRQR